MATAYKAAYAYWCSCRPARGNNTYGYTQKWHSLKTVSLVYAEMGFRGSKSVP